MRSEVFTTYARYTPTAPYQGTGWMGAGLGMMAWGQWRGWIGAWLGYNTCLWWNHVTGAVIATTTNWYTGPSWDLFMRIAYQLYPESLVLEDWTLRGSGGFSDEPSFGSGHAHNWHAPGDANSVVELPHQVPFYL